MRSLLFMVLAIGLSLSAIAQSPIPEAPRTLLRFLKPGDLVGVQFLEGTTSVIISKYAKDRFDLAKLMVNRSRVNAQELAAESELAQNAFENFLSQNAQSGFVESLLMVIPLMRTSSLGTIAEVGDDYILVDFDDTKGQCVIAKASVGRIYLDANPANFFGSRRVAERKGE